MFMLAGIRATARMRCDRRRLNCLFGEYSRCGPEGSGSFVKTDSKASDASTWRNSLRGGVGYALPQWDAPTRGHSPCRFPVRFVLARGPVVNNEPPVLATRSFPRARGDGGRPGLAINSSPRLSGRAT